MRALDLAERLAQQAETVAAMLLPCGKREGAEWRCGSVHGEAGDSLGVHLTGAKAGVWRDFSANEGGDLIGLWMAAKGLSLRDACEAAMEHLGIQSDRPRHFAKPYRKPAREGVHRLTPEHSAWLRDVRKLPDETVTAYRLASRGERLMFPYLRGDELVFAKYRKLPKQFSAEADCEPILFGWQAIAPDARAVILAEGELDAMAWHAYGWPALSVPTGAGAHAWVEGEFEALEPFDTIYLSFDMDDAGQRSIADLADRLGRERCKVVRLPHKDANECLVRDVPRGDMTKALKDARTLDPSELRNIGEFEDAIVAEMSRVDEGMRLPWNKTYDRFRLRPGELSIWAGINGHGKSQLASQIVAYQACNGIRCCVASMEWRTPRWALRMQRQIGAVESLTESYSRSLTHALSSTLWTFNISGSAKGNRVLEVFKYARRRYGIELFLLDNLTKCGFADDDYSGQKQFAEALADFTRETDCHVMLVAHMRKGESEDRPPGKFDVKGSGGITDMAPTVVCVWRNKAREHAIEFARAAEQRGAPFALPAEFVEHGNRAMDAQLIVHKQNETGDEPVFNLWFDKRTGQFLAQADHTPRAMMPLVGLAHTGNAA